MPVTLIYKLEIYLGISLVLSWLPWGKRILFPFQIFTTWVHECCHAVAAVCMGGGTITITVSADGSGLTHFHIPKGKLRQSVVASAGYLGASFVGCALFYLSFQVSAHRMLLALVCALVFTLVFWVRNTFAVLSVGLMTAALASLIYSPWHRFSFDVLVFLSIQTALNGVFDIRELYRVKAPSDAHTLKKFFYLPAWFWATLWMGLSIFMMYETMRCLKLI